MEEFNLLGIDGVSEYAHSSAPNKEAQLNSGACVGNRRALIEGRINLHRYHYLQAIRAQISRFLVT